jgi:hypothetical protein
MSLEQALKDNTAAVLAHNALLEKMLAAGGKAASTGKPTAASDEKPAGKPTGKPASGKSSKPKAPTSEDVAARVTGYLKGVETKAERDERKEHVRRIIEYYGVEKFTAIDEDKFTEALGMLDDFEAGNEPELLSDPDNEGGEEDGDEDDNMV